jgi:hypothetical protein
MVSISSQEDFSRREHHLLAHCVEKTSPQTLPQYTIHSFYCKKYAAVSSLSLYLSRADTNCQKMYSLSRSSH